MRRWRVLLSAITVALAGCTWGGGSRQVIRRPPVSQRLEARHLFAGAPVFIRIFKTSDVLELWLRDGDRYRLFDTYPICRWSGGLGPKLREGDWQSPEGFYVITPAQMNPRSRFHRAFNLGFPNAYDRANGRTGSDLMVHGGCDSAGCFAMTDAQIDEVFNLMQAAFARGQTAIAVDVLPFQPTERAFREHGSDRWAPFWRTLARGEASFDRTGLPAAVFACGRAYAFADGPGCERIREGG
jgi:murein L,D-transpeptidase YafK